MQQPTLNTEGDGTYRNSIVGQTSLGAIMSQTQRHVYMSEQQLLPSAATTSVLTQPDARIRLPQHHQVTPIAPALTMPANAMVATHQAHQLAHLQGLHNMQQQPFNIYRPQQMAQEAIFKDQKLRSGKWTPEEEAYADILIELFVKGQVDLENGSTLRSFLAKKLHCAPMRVTKKYAGKSKGKASYLGKKNSVAIDPVGYQRNMTRLETAKKNFLKAVYPELSVNHQTSHMGVTPQTQSLIMPLIPNPTVNATSWPQYPFPISNLTVVSNASPYGVLSANPNPPVEISSRPSIAVIGPGSQSLLHTRAPPPNAPHANMKSQTLHESFLNAFHNSSMTQSVPATLPVARNQQQQLLHNAYVTATEGSGVRAPPAAPPVLLRSEPPTRQPVNTMRSQMPVGPHASNTASVHQATEMPDFLKGFDKVTGLKSNAAPGPSSSEHHHTPTFTSRSFDDCHRLLGQNLSPMILGRPTGDRDIHQSVSLLPANDGLKSHSTMQHRQVAKPTIAQHGWSENATKQQQTSVGNKANPDLLSQTFTEAMNRASSKKQPAHHLGADYYNMFAQQTALVASQHSAYLGGPDNERRIATRSSATIPFESL